jgi:THO complex subunit 7
VSGETVAAMAAHYAISPAEDDAVIRQRLLTRTTTTRGEPPLKKLIKKFTALVGEIEKEESKYAECEKLYRSLLQELATFELPLLKTKAVIEANRREQESFRSLRCGVSLVQVRGDSTVFSLPTCVTIHEVLSSAL